MSEAANHNSCRIRGSRCRRYHALYADIVSANPPQSSLGKDLVKWKHDGDDYREKFTSNTTWNLIRAKKDREQWSRVVWFSQGVSVG